MRCFYSSGSQKHTTPPSCNHAQARKLVDLIDVPGCLDKGNYIQKQIRIEPDSCLHTFRSSKLNGELYFHSLRICIYFFFVCIIYLWEICFATAARKNPRNMCTRRFYSAGSQKHTTPPPFDPKQWQYLDSHVTGDELPQQIKLDDPTKHAQARRLINLVDIPGCLNKKGKYIQKQIWIDLPFPTTTCPTCKIHSTPPFHIFTLSIYHLSHIGRLSNTFHLQSSCFGMQCLNNRWEHDMASILYIYNSFTQIHLYHYHLPNLVKCLPQYKPFHWRNIRSEALCKVIGYIVYLAYLIEFASWPHNSMMWFHVICTKEFLAYNTLKWCSCVLKQHVYHAIYRFINSPLNF